MLSQVYLEHVNKRLEEIISFDTNKPKLLKDAMYYSVLAGGKRFRPVFLLAIIDAYGVDFRLGIDAACAVEMIHTYSLIHDDLPCMDNDDLRRGQPTNHIIYGEGMATLAGDALLTDAFNVILNSELNSEILVKITRLLSQYSGSIGMIKGQVLDILSENKTISAEDLKLIHIHKTADLLKFCAQTAGLIAGKTDSQSLEALEKMALYMGLAFQVKDDILDVYGSTEELGKIVGSDIANNKNTYVSLFGLEKASKLLNEYIEQAYYHMEQANFVNNTQIKYLIDFMVKRTK